MLTVQKIQFSVQKGPCGHADSGKIHFSSLHKSDISATALRKMIKQNESFKNFVSKENYEYIEKNGLYK